MIVDPAPGALVRDPVTKLALARGAEVDEHDPYWSRAIADGDVTPAGDAAAPEPALADAAPALEVSEHA